MEIEQLEQEIIPLNTHFIRSAFQERVQRSGQQQQQQIMSLNLLQVDGSITLIDQLSNSMKNMNNLIILRLNLSRQNWGSDQANAFSDSITLLRFLREFDINLSFNYIGDRGHESLTLALSKLSMLESIKVDLQRTGLQKRSLSLLEIFNVLSNVNSFDLKLDSNELELEEELKILLPKFRSETIFSNIRKLEISFSEIKKYSNTQGVQIACNQSNSFPPQHVDIKQIDNQILVIQSQLKQLGEYLKEMTLRGYNNFHPQWQQIMHQMQQMQQNIQQLLIKRQKYIDKPVQKKTMMSRVLEIMLKFTSNLEQFALTCPGYLMDSNSWEQFGQLLKIKTDKLTHFTFIGLDSNQRFQQIDYFLYQLGKLRLLKHLKLCFVNTNSVIPLSRFISDLPALQRVIIDLSNSTNQETQDQSMQSRGESNIVTEINTFMHSLQFAKGLVELDMNLSQLKWSDQEAFLFSQNLSQLKSITILRIYLANCNSFTDQGAKYLINAVFSLSQIYSLQLDLSSTGISSETVHTNMFSEFPKLKRTLMSLRINLSHLRSLDQSLISKQLEQLNLKKCVVTFPHNQFIRIHQNKATQINRMLVMCQKLRQSRLPNIFRHEILEHALCLLVQPQSELA